MSYNISIEEITLENDDIVDVINARELHAALEVRTGFNRWINRRILSNNYIEGYDFWYEENELSRLDYLVSIDMAQELAILERNDLSYSVRDFVIEARNDYLDYMKNKNILQENKILDLEEEIRGIKISHLKNLVRKYSEVQNLHIVDGYITFVTEFNSHQNSNVTAGDIFKSHFFLEKAINLAEQLTRTESVEEIAFD